MMSAIDMVSRWSISSSMVYDVNKKLLRKMVSICVKTNLETRFGHSTGSARKSLKKKHLHGVSHQTDPTWAAGVGRPAGYH